MTEKEAIKKVGSVIDAMAFKMANGVSCTVGSVKDQLGLIIKEIYSDIEGDILIAMVARQDELVAGGNQEEDQ